MRIDSPAQIAGLVVLAAIPVIAIFSPTHFLEPTASKASVEKSSTEKPRSNGDFAYNAAFLKRNPHFLAATTQLITQHGYDCPAVTHLYSRGESPYGLRLEVLCGPRGTTDAYVALHYAVYPDRLIVKVCRPFTTFGPECE